MGQPVKSIQIDVRVRGAPHSGLTSFPTNVGPTPSLRLPFCLCYPAFSSIGVPVCVGRVIRYFCLANTAKLPRSRTPVHLAYFAGIVFGVTTNDDRPQLRSYNGHVSRSTMPRPRPVGQRNDAIDCETTDGKAR